MKKLLLNIAALMFATTAAAQSTVYFTNEITPEALVKIYEAIGLTPTEGQRVAVKISTGESSRSNHLRPDLIKNLVQGVGGNIVECNTAYGGSRSSTASHRRAIEERGYNEIATVDIMDEEGTINLPVTDTKHLQYDIDIHSAGSTQTSWRTAAQDDFLESMAAAAQAVHNYFKQEGRNIVYINVMNNLSVDCDCDGNPATPQMNDIGILASTDPVALDKACLDLVFNYNSTAGDDATALQNRINRQHGTHIVDYAEQIGLGSKQYTLIDLDQQSGINGTTTNDAHRYNVYSLDGKKLLSNAHNLKGLAKGTYIVNGEKVIIQ